MTTQTEHSRAASIFQRLGELKPTAETDARALILSGDGGLLFQALKDEYPILKDALRILERIFDAHPFSTTYLLSHLAFWAGQQKDTEVFDAVNLWMHNKGPTEVLQALEALAQEPMRPRARKRVQLWIGQQLSYGDE